MKNFGKNSAWFLMLVSKVRNRVGL